MERDLPQEHGIRFIAVAALLLALGPSGLGGAEPPPIPDEIVQLRVESANYSPSRRALEVVLQAEVAEGWHVNAHQPSSDAMIATTLTVTPPAGFAVGEIEYPPAESRRFAFTAGKAIRVYSGRVRFRVPLSVAAGIDSQGASFAARLHYQACDDTRCLPPRDVERTFLVRRPADLEAGSSSAAGAGSPTPVDRWLAQYGLAPTLLLIFLMGLGLNLTPCVYPLISVTVAYFGGQAREQRGRAVLLAGVYALGIALTFSALGVSAAFSGGMFGSALQRPMTLIGMAALMVALAASSFGLYTLRPPAWLLQRAGKAGGGFVGALFMGLTMGIVAAPCVGPVVVGLLLVVGARGEALLGFGLFFTLALGLGAPYVLLGAVAGSIARLPRAGEWLVWVERLFGFVLLGLALYFVSPLLSTQTLEWTAAGLIALAGITLGFLDPHGRELRHFPLFKRLAGSAAVLAALWAALPSAGAKPTAISWQEFSPAALEQARSEGRPAVVDFRADWCLPCIEMERTTFVSAPVAARAAQFAMLRADVTEMSREAEATLSKYGVLGVPTTLFFAPSGREHRRRVGYIDVEQFSQLLDETRAATPDGD
ncbi:MAG: thioredoxin family protein [Deltaproteobacteria bacterium]|nr:thioredoxin family protein [Deltaproteobacteria bacterium]